MQPDKSIEARLRHSLMPTALSESASDSIHTMLDELAAGGGTATSPAATAPAAAGPPPGTVSGPGHKPWIAAAAVATLLGVTAWMAGEKSPGTAPPAPTTAQADGGDDDAAAYAATGAMRLVDEATHLESIEDQGWLSDPDGGTHHAVHIQVVEEDRLLDEETGIIVHVASPREETLLMPVSTF